MPELNVTLAGKKLYQNADYRVIVEESATETGIDYRATIEGMNEYSGTRADAAIYQVSKCSVSNCKIAATTRLFNWERQEPAKVTLVDNAGNVLLADKKGSVGDAEFVWSIPETPDGADETGKQAYSDGKYYDYIHAHSKSYKYDIVVEAKETSAHYEGSTRQAVFQIKVASLYHGPLGSEAEGHDPTAHYDKVVWDGQEWDYMEAYSTKGLIKIKYTGSPIEPTIKNPTYLGRPLTNGTGQKYYLSPTEYHYRYIYGNPNPDPSHVVSHDCINATGSDEANLASMTIRYTPNGDFDNYINVFFEITPASIVDDVNVTGADSAYTYTGKEIRPLKLTYNGMTLEEGVDFTAKYTDSVNAGIAKVAITGKGNYTGSITKEFSIVQAENPLSINVLKKNVKAKKVKKKAQKVTAFKVLQAAGTVSFKLVKTKKTKSFKVNAKGQVTVPKKTKKGTYKVKVEVKATGDANYKPITKTVTAKIKVK